MLYCVLSCLYPINSVFNKPRCCALYLPQLSMLEIRCVLPWLCLKQLPSLAVKRDLVWLYLKLITYQRFVCCAVCLNRLNSILHIPFLYVVFVSSNFYLPHCIVLCRVFIKHDFSPELVLCLAWISRDLSPELVLCRAWISRDLSPELALVLCHEWISRDFYPEISLVLSRVYISCDFYPEHYLK
jgi:hypothetical protein